MQISTFGSCMVKYCDAQQHQLSRLSHLSDDARVLYSKALDEAKVPTLERAVAELRQKLAEVTKSYDMLGNQIKKVRRLETEVASLQQEHES